MGFEGVGVDCILESLSRLFVMIGPGRVVRSGLHLFALVTAELQSRRVFYRI